ncbi:hypothetical protein QP185_13255 [Sphingomonas aerolata]|uniref:hypothetical protein n=1 Tax=Sphingomonas aerolata TaxID=185951 RepID=UPI002FE0C314
MSRDRVLWGATGLLRLMLVLNIVCAAVFALALLMSWPMQDMLSARLAHKYGAMLDLDQAVLAIRMMLFVGIAGGVALHPIFSNLLRIVATVEAGIRSSTTMPRGSRGSAGRFWRCNASISPLAGSSAGSRCSSST